MNDTEVEWTTPAPLWDNVNDLDSKTRQVFRQPVLLRFATDTFMNDFITLLETNPRRMKEFFVQPETWRGPAITPVIESVDKVPILAKRLQRSRLALLRVGGTAILNPPGNEPSPTSGTVQNLPPLKLYQPAHQRFYLILACLVCGLPGLPDRHIETSNQERVSYVIRRVKPTTGKPIEQSTEEEWEEYAFVNTSAGSEWQKVKDAHSLNKDEDQIPLSAMSFLQDDGHKRRLLVGLVPVGKREAYVGASERDLITGKLVSDPHATIPDPRQVMLRSQVTEPWKATIERAASAIKMLSAQSDKPSMDLPMKDGNTAAYNEALTALREQIQTTSWYVLLDFVTYLKNHLKDVWQVITGEKNENALTDQDQIAVLKALKDTDLKSDLAETLVDTSAGQYELSDVKTSLVEALKAVADPAVANQLEAATRSYLRTKIVPKSKTDPASMWPDWLFPLTDPELPELAPHPPDGTAPLKGNKWDKDGALKKIDQFVDLIMKAEIKQPIGVTPPLPLAAQPVMNVNSPAWFVIRCIFERPNCSPLQPTVISDATRPFQMAGFFDPDAPARPIRIALPIDTSPAGLRKFDKNTAFMISDILCGQIDRFKSLSLGDLVRSVLPWPLHKDLDVPDTGPCTVEGTTPEISLGMICSLSIPIITICALILLMIIVSLLDIIFRWIPFFIMCFPLPGFKAKPST